ncbi:choice-of-anchor D domain-containing protein [Massilia atriviolacea]|uniref:Choice-of-anchor D domain-containing protein n=2 Tax=Massilia atriviolacea TaxID=2495579 RepID=A0A430HUU9_9BURK|nr:choice-of-anchor D domain-containing protein [Massilia atriviolacea]
MGQAHAADALRGKTLYLNGPTGGGTACARCHTANPATNVSRILSAANNPAAISAAIAANKGGMGNIYAGKFVDADLADIAAFIGNPGVTGAPAASLTPSSLAFSGTLLGQTGSALAATLANTGTSALTIDTIGVTGAAAADFSIAGGTCAPGGAVAAGANCTVLVSFKPSVAGARSATLAVAHNGTGGTSSVALSGTASASPQATIGVSATSIDFGALAINAPSAPQSITINNSGQSPLTFSALTLGGANPAIFSLGGACAVSKPLAAGASCALTVVAQPTAGGAFAGNLTVASNAANGNVTIGLAGSGASATAAASATPSALAFGSQTIGSAAGTQSVTLANTGNVSLAFSSIAFNGAAAFSVAPGTHCGAPLAPGATCSVPVLFAPSAAGSFAATLVASFNGGAVQVAVSGAGTTAAVATPTLSDTGPVGFGEIQVGKSAAPHTTVLRNPGTAALKIATLAIDGANGGDFVLGGTCAADATVSPAGSCTIETTFKPGAPGARSARLLLATDGGTQFALPLAGTGTAVAAAPSLTLTPQSFDFGASTANKRFTLGNAGTAAINLASATFSGPFARVPDASGCAALPFALQPGASCDLVVAYTPAASGASSGSVVLRTDTGASWTIALAGQAAATPAAPAPAQNQGGGGCSSVRGGSDPMLALLALMAAAVLLWRRRNPAQP